MIEFGTRLRFLRKRSSLTQKELGKALNISASSIGMYERGIREPSFELLFDIASYFNVSIDYLLGFYQEDSTNKGKVSYPKLSTEEKQVLLLKFQYPDLFEQLLNATPSELKKVTKILKIIRND